MLILSLLFLKTLTIEIGKSTVPKENSGKCPRFQSQRSGHLQYSTLLGNRIPFPRDETPTSVLSISKIQSEKYKNYIIYNNMLYIIHNKSYKVTLDTRWALEIKTTRSNDNLGKEWMKVMHSFITTTTHEIYYTEKCRDSPTSLLTSEQSGVSSFAPLLLHWVRFRPAFRVLHAPKS